MIEPLKNYVDTQREEASNVEIKSDELEWITHWQLEDSSEFSHLLQRTPEVFQELVAEDICWLAG
jgi:hypothetical protein